MPPPEDPDKVDELLTEKIEELESLLDNKEDPAQVDIPVLETLADGDSVSESEVLMLDELVTSEEYVNEQKELDNKPEIPAYTSDQIMEIINNI